MLKRILGIILLICMIVPLTYHAEEKQNVLSIVLLMEDRFLNTDNTFEFSLDMLVHAAEMKGRTVELYSYDKDAGYSKFYQTGDVYPMSLPEAFSAAGNPQDIDGRPSAPTFESMAGKDILLLVGQLDACRQALAEATSWLSAAANIQALAVTASDTATQQTLTSLLLSCQIIPHSHVSTLKNNWYIADDSIAVREYHADETMTQRLMSALDTQNTLIEQVLADKKVMLIPEVMKQPVLSLSLSKEAELSLVAPDGQRFALMSPLSEQPTATKDTADTTAEASVEATPVPTVNSTEAADATVEASVEATPVPTAGSIKAADATAEASVETTPVPAVGSTEAADATAEASVEATPAPAVDSTKAADATAEASVEASPVPAAGSTEATDATAEASVETSPVPVAGSTDTAIISLAESTAAVETSQTVETSFFTAYLLEKETTISVLVFFHDNAYGEWHMETEAEFNQPTLHYIPGMLDIPASLVKNLHQNSTTAASATTSNQSVFSLGTNLQKNQTYMMEFNKDLPIIQELRAKYGENVRFTLSAPDSDMSSDPLTFIKDRAGTYNLTGSLFLYEYLACTQQYSISLSNAAPQFIGSIPTEIQERYWDLQFRDNKLSISLEDFATDADGEPLTWTIASLDSAEFNNQIHLSDILIEVTSTAIEVNWPQGVSPHGNYAFLLRVEDTDGGRAEQQITLHAQSMQKELEALSFHLVSPADMSTLRAKGETETLRFQSKGSQGLAPVAVIDYLTRYMNVQISLDNTPADWQTVSAPQTDGTYSTSITYPRTSGTFNIQLQLTTTDNAPVPFSNAYVLTSVKVDNIAPQLSKYARSGWTLHLNPQAELSVFSAEDFTDKDKDELNYIISTRTGTSLWNMEVVETARYMVLPYRFTPHNFGVWKITAKAADEAGLESPILTQTFLVVPWYTVVAIAILLLLIVLVPLFIIVHMLKPVFPRGSHVNAVCECGQEKSEIVLYLDHWKRDAVPLDRLLACGGAPMISRECCELLSKVLIKPQRDGIKLLDKTPGKMLREIHGRIDYDETVYFELKNLIITLSLSIPYEK